MWQIDYFRALINDHSDNRDTNIIIKKDCNLDEPSLNNHLGLNHFHKWLNLEYYDYYSPFRATEKFYKICLNDYPDSKISQSKCSENRSIRLSVLENSSRLRSYDENFSKDHIDQIEQSPPQPENITEENENDETDWFERPP